MPITIQGRTFQKFAHAEAWVRKHMTGINNPAAFVASSEQRQMKKRAAFHKKTPSKD